MKKTNLSIVDVFSKRTWLKMEATEKILLQICNPTFKCALIFGYFPISIDRKRRSLQNTKQSFPLYLICPIIMATIQSLWILWYGYSNGLMLFSRSFKNSFTNALGFTLWGVCGIGIITVIICHRISKRTEFLSFWTMLIHLSTKLFDLIISTKSNLLFQSGVENIKKYILKRIFCITLAILVLVSRELIIYIWISHPENSIFKLCIGFARDFFVSSHPISFLPIFLFVQYFTLCFELLEIVLREFIDSEKQVMLITLTDSKNARFMLCKDESMTIFLNLLNELENVINAFNMLYSNEFSAIVFVCGINALMSAYNLSTSPKKLVLIAYSFVVFFLYTKALWDICCLSTTMSRAAMQVFKLLEHISVENLEENTKFRVNKRAKLYDMLKDSTVCNFRIETFLKF